MSTYNTLNRAGAHYNLNLIDSLLAKDGRSLTKCLYVSFKISMNRYDFAPLNDYFRSPGNEEGIPDIEIGCTKR